MKQVFVLIVSLLIVTSCTSPLSTPATVPVSTGTHQANMANPASVYCKEQGYRLEIHADATGNQAGYCLFPDGSECDEWAYFRGECGNAAQSEEMPFPSEIPTPMPINPDDYQGWWTYTHPDYGFSLLLPEDWKVEEITSSNPQMSEHTLNLHPTYGTENIRMTFRHVGEDVLLWPTGVGQGEFVQQGSLDIAGQPAQRLLLVCPTGEITSIWYHDAEGQPNITRGDLEFGFIFSVGGHCEPGRSLNGKVQRVGEMIIASITVP